MPEFKNTTEVQGVITKTIKDLQKGLITPKKAERIADGIENFLEKIPAYKKMKEADNARDQEN